MPLLALLLGMNPPGINLMLTWCDMAVHLGVTLSCQINTFLKFHLRRVVNRSLVELFSIQVNEFGRGTKDNLGEVFAKVKDSVLI